MILLIDNYDSFSYNLFQLVGEIEPDIKVIRNDEMTINEIRDMKPDRIILSPGPGRPEDAPLPASVLGSRIPPDFGRLVPKMERQSRGYGESNCISYKLGCQNKRQTNLSKIIY